MPKPAILEQEMRDINGDAVAADLVMNSANTHVWYQNYGNQFEPNAQPLPGYFVAGSDNKIEEIVSESVLRDENASGIYTLDVTSPSVSIDDLDTDGRADRVVMKPNRNVDLDNGVTFGAQKWDFKLATISNNIAMKADHDRQPIPRRRTRLP